MITVFIGTKARFTNTLRVIIPNGADYASANCESLDILEDDFNCRNEDIQRMK